MKNHKQLPPEERKRNALLIVAGSILLLLLLSFGSWYLLKQGSQAGTPVVPVDASGTTAASGRLVETDEPPLEIPEAAPEDEAPGTPTPGFIDDFEDGLDPVWTIHYGDPFIANGQLTSNVGAGLAAGDASWRNYQVDFDVDATRIDCPFADTSNSVGVRVVDFDHAYWFVFTSCEAGWSLFPGGILHGTLSLFPDTRVSIENKAKHITIKVEESKMSVYANGTLLSSIVDSSFATGGVFLQTEAQTFYDNFKVTLLP